MSHFPARKLAAMALAPVAALALGACQHVNRKELDTRLADLQTGLREEYQTADAELGGRIDANGNRIARTENRVDGLENDLRTVEARTAALETDLRALAVEMNATVERFENALAFNVPVTFEFDSAVVRAEDRPVLERFAAVVNDHYPDTLITVEGFTDSIGSVDYNLKLGQRRADAVRSVLVEEGVDSGRLRSVSYGESPDRQVAPGLAGPGKAGEPNRRVTLVIETAESTWDVASAQGGMAAQDR